MRAFAYAKPGVSLRSTPGYLLSSLRDEKTDCYEKMVLQRGERGTLQELNEAMAREGTEQNFRSGQECPLSVFRPKLALDQGDVAQSSGRE